MGKEILGVAWSSGYLTTGIEIVQNLTICMAMIECTGWISALLSNMVIIKELAECQQVLSWNAANFRLPQLLTTSLTSLFLKNASWKMNGNFSICRNVNGITHYFTEAWFIGEGNGNYVWDLKLQSLGIFSTFQKKGRSGQNFIILAKGQWMSYNVTLTCYKNQIRTKLEWF